MGEGSNAVRGEVRAAAAHSNKPVPDIRVDGPCVQGTLASLNLPDSATIAVRDQAELLIGDVVGAYVGEFGPGEVGADGSARASSKRPAGGFGPTGLLYGRIQSGKTAAMIASTALAIDNGFRVVIVLTTNFVELIDQTAKRFRSALTSSLVLDSTRAEVWEDDSDNIRKHSGRIGLVLICAKDPRHLANAAKLLGNIGAANYPAVILDDEADQASLDNNTRKRSIARKKALESGETEEQVAATKIHDLIRDLRDAVPHNVFVQVTATPYALLLQNVDSPFRPSFTRLLEPGEGYTGGEHFFSEQHIGVIDPDGDEDCESSAPPLPPLVFVDETESDNLDDDEAPPHGLERAIAYFLVAGAVQALSDPRARRKGQNFLCHTSHKKSEHTKLDRLIKRFLSSLEDDLTAGNPRAHSLIAWGYHELERTKPEISALQDVLDDIGRRLPLRALRVVNSEGKAAPEVPGAYNFIIGGNIIGRGLTIPNLLVTYYLRRPQTSQMDTMLQHARMFGYRAQLMPLTRVFLPRSLAIRFHSIHRAERELRSLLTRVDALSAIPVEVVGKLRATRYGVLDTASVVAVGSGSHRFPVEPPHLSSANRQRLEEFVRVNFPDADFDSKQRRDFGAQVIESNLASELIELFEEDEDWKGSAIGAVLKATSPSVDLRYRAMQRRRSAGQGRELPTGALSGPVLKAARETGRPTLFLLKHVGSASWPEEFWYPTVVFPESMKSIVYNEG